MVWCVHQIMPDASPFPTPHWGASCAFFKKVFMVFRKDIGWQDIYDFHDEFGDKVLV